VMQMRPAAFAGDRHAAAMRTVALTERSHPSSDRRGGRAHR